MSAQLLEALAARTANTQAGLAVLRAQVARRMGLQVGQRVTFAFCGDERATMHGFVVELARRPADDVPGAWVRVIGYPAWVHFALLDEVRAVCGVCQDCLALNDRPGCADEGRRVQP